MELAKESELERFRLSACFFFFLRIYHGSLLFQPVFRFLPLFDAAAREVGTARDVADLDDDGGPSLFEGPTGNSDVLIRLFVRMWFRVIRSVRFVPWDCLDGLCVLCDSLPIPPPPSPDPRSAGFTLLPSLDARRIHRAPPIDGAAPLASNATE